MGACVLFQFDYSAYLHSIQFSVESPPRRLFFLRKHKRVEREIENFIGKQKEEEQIWLTFIDITVASASAIFQIETGQILQYFAQRLLLILTGFSNAQHLMSAKFADFIPLEHVIFSHPTQLPGRIVSHASQLEY